LGRSLIGSTQLVNKVYFPRLIIPLASIRAGLIDLAISTCILLALMAWYSLNPVMAPLLVVGVVFTALGVGTFLSALTVAYRDFRYLIPLITQFWMFPTPAIYLASLVPAALAARPQSDDSRASAPRSSASHSTSLPFPSPSALPSFCSSPA
jgi:lipopolysaccharide transport system permease protein